MRIVSSAVNMLAGMICSSLRISSRQRFQSGNNMRTLSFTLTGPRRNRSETKTRRRSVVAAYAVASVAEILEPRALLSAAPVNLVTNSGLETGMSNWSWIGNGAAANFAIDTTVAHSGYASVKLSDSSSFSSGLFGAFTQNISGLTIGNTYYVSAWVKGSGVGSHAQIEVNPDWATRANIPSGTYNWTQVQLSFVAQATTVPLLLAVQDPTTALWIDDISVTATGSYVNNGGFEGGTSNWNWSANGGVSASNTIDTTTSHSGTSSIKLVDSTSFTAGAYADFYQDVSGLTKGNTYYLSAWVKGTNVGSLDRIYVDYAGLGTANIPTGTFDWTQVRTSFVATGTSSRVRFTVQDLTPSLWIDDVVVTDSRNMVTNSSFNQNSNTNFASNGINGWNFFTGGGAAATATLDTSTSHWQGGSVLLTDASGFAANVFGAISQNISGLTVGKTYRIDAYVRGSGVGTSAHILTNTDWATRLTLPSGNYDWTLVSLAFVANATTVPLLFSVQDPTTALWIDDVSVTDPAAVVNANFNNPFGTIDTSSKIEQIGSGWDRIDSNWASVQPTSGGGYNWSSLDATIADAIFRGTSPDVLIAYSPAWASTNGNKINPPSNLTDLANFVTALVNRYKNVVHVWEAWNEANGPDGFSGTVAQYGDMVKTIYTAAKLADPNCTVLLGASAGADKNYLSALYELNLGQYFDAVAIHPYQGTLDTYLILSAYTSDLVGIRTTMNNAGDTNKPIWLTEFGWSTNAGQQTYQSQAQLLAQNFVTTLTFQSMGVTQAFWYSATERSDGFGLLDSSGNQKQSYWAYQGLTNVLSGSTYKGAVTLGTGVNANAFQAVDGTGTLAIWSQNATAVTLSNVLVGSFPVFRDINGNLMTATLGANGYQITSTSSMIYVTNCSTSLFSSSVLPSLPSYTPGSKSNPVPTTVWASVVTPTTTERAFLLSGKTSTLKVFVENQGTTSASGSITASIAGLTTPASKSYTLAAGASITLSFSFSVPASTAAGSLLTATITGTKNGSAIVPGSAQISITKKNSVQFLAHSPFESQYLFNAGGSGAAASIRFGGAPVYLFDLTGTTTASLSALYGDAFGGSWAIQVSTDNINYTTVSSGTGSVATRTVNLNAYAGAKLYVKFISLPGSWGPALNYLSLVSG